MNQTASIGSPAPEFLVSEWVQGENCHLSQLFGRVVLIEVFQVNCPGCFLYSLPQAVDLFQRYHNKGLTVLGIATAFEDFEINTVDNLRLLLEQNRVVGETQRVLAENNRLIDNRLPYHLPFPVAMDKINRQAKQLTEDEISHFINQYIPGYPHQNESEQLQIRGKVLNHLNARFVSAETFKAYRLQGTPSHIVIDKKGILKASEFGHHADLEWVITSLLVE